jgi:GNAT superfamily N-acetyltransferase
MNELICREYRPEDIHDLLAVRNAIFPPLSVAQWRACEPAMTASLAYLNGEPVGAIPLDQRDFQVAPGAIIRSAFENAVGTREDMRSRGIGTAMIAAAREFLADRCDTLMVYRGGERSTGYNFYVKSGHRDLIYVRQAVWEPGRVGASVPDARAPGDRRAYAAILGLDDLLAEEESVLQAHRLTYGGYGGFPPRHVGYWRQAMSAMIYEVIPQDTVYVRCPAQGELRGYLLAGHARGRTANDTWVVQDAAGEPGAVRECFMALGDMAATQDRKIVMYLSSEHPWHELCRCLGFQEGPRHLMVMGQLVRPQELVRQTCTDLNLLAGLRVKVWTPTVDYVLWEDAPVRREVTIEAKDEYLTRLLCRRLDLRAAVESDLVSLQHGDAATLQRLSAAFPYCPWVYLHMDYV